jgi:hypothetical protein
MQSSLVAVEAVEVLLLQAVVVEQVVTLLVGLTFQTQ